MNVLPIRRLQSYFRELEIAEAARNTEPPCCNLDAKNVKYEFHHIKGPPVYYGGPTELREALLAEGYDPLNIPREEPQPQLSVRRIESNGNMVILWWVIGVLVVSHFVRW
jgi:hypothetical protein